MGRKEVHKKKSNRRDDFLLEMRPGITPGTRNPFVMDPPGCLALAAPNTYCTTKIDNGDYVLSLLTEVGHNPFERGKRNPAAAAAAVSARFDVLHSTEKSKRCIIF